MEKSFFELLKESLDEVELIQDEADEEVCNEAFLRLSEEEMLELQEELGIDQDEMEVITEAIIRSVDSTGNIKRNLSRDVRRRRATATTGVSTAERKRRARRAVMTKKRNPAILRKAMKKRNRALRKRRSLRLS